MIASMRSFHITEWQAYFNVKKALENLKNDFDALQAKYKKKARQK